MGDFANTVVKGGKLNSIQAQPFLPLIQHIPPRTLEVSFNQAYVFDYGNAGNPEAPIKISGMDVSYPLHTIKKEEAEEAEEAEGVKDRKWFYVKMLIGSNDEVTSACMSVYYPDDPDRLLQPESTDKIKYVLVCKYDKNVLKHFYLRDNIHYGGGAVLPPYYVRLVMGKETSYAVTVTEGYVGEVIPGYGDALKYHQADNHYTEEEEEEEEEDSCSIGGPPKKGGLKEHSIPVGQAVYVKFDVARNGTVEGSITIHIDDDGKTSNHYQPKVDDKTSLGVAGTMYYKLAVLEDGVDGEDPKLKLYLSGSHIPHIQDLPPIRSTKLSKEGDGDKREAGIGVLTKKWDNQSAEYYLRALVKEYGQLHIETTESDVIVRGNKKDSDLIVWEGDLGIKQSSLIETKTEVLDPETGETTVETTEKPYPLIEFRDGLNTTGADVEGNEHPKKPPEDLEFFIPTVIKGNGIEVVDVGKKGKIYQISATGGGGGGGGSKSVVTQHNPTGAGPAVHKIAEHSDGAGLDVNINETITSLSAGAGANLSKLIYDKEDGPNDEVEVPIPFGYESYEVSICINGTPTAVHIVALSADLT